MDCISWPDPSKIISNKKPSTMIQLESLFYNAGYIVTAVYLIVLVVLKPLLEKSYDQRIELSAGTLLQLRILVNSLLRRVKSPIVSIVFDNTRDKVSNYIDRYTQTDNLFENVDDGTNCGLGLINKRLNDLKRSLDMFNFSNQSSPHLDSFTFQTKLIIDQINGYNLHEKVHKTSNEINQSIREIKGWFINGKIPY